jgi:hypothetical protein
VSRSHRPVHFFQKKLASFSRVQRARRLADAPALKSDDKLIADAVAAGRVNCIPAGVSGLSAPGPKRAMQSKPHVV